MDTAARIGDDALQRASRGRVVPDSFTHGTSEQRQTVVLPAATRPATRGVRHLPGGLSEPDEQGRQPAHRCASARRAAEERRRRPPARRGTGCRRRSDGWRRRRARAGAPRGSTATEARAARTDAAGPAGEAVADAAGPPHPVSLEAEFWAAFRDIAARRGRAGQRARRRDRRCARARIGARLGDPAPRARMVPRPRRTLTRPCRTHPTRGQRGEGVEQPEGHVVKPPVSISTPTPSRSTPIACSIGACGA